MCMWNYFQVLYTKKKKIQSKIYPEKKSKYIKKKKYTVEHWNNFWTMLTQLFHTALTLQCVFTSFSIV